MIESLVNVFKIPELRRKIFFTLLIIAVYRLGMFIPIPGTHAEYLRTLIEQGQSGLGGGGLRDYLSFIARITGGSFQPFLFALGIMPYISASIILQLLTRRFRHSRNWPRKGRPGAGKSTSTRGI